MSDYYGSHPKDIFSMLKKRETELMRSGAETERLAVQDYLSRLSIRYDELGQQQLSLTLEDIARRIGLGEHREDGHV